MSDSSPADLAVAFRGFPRRLREALANVGDDAGAQATARSHADAVNAHLTEAAGLLGAPGSGDAANVASAVADHIASVQPERWDDAVLAGLRVHALAIGAEMRAIADLAR